MLTDVHTRGMLRAVPLLGGLLCATAMHPARATPITYTYEAGTTFTLSDGDTGTLSGSFTIDPPGNSLSSPDVVITGSAPEAGTYAPYDYEGGGEVTYARMAVDIAIGPGSDFQVLIIDFDQSIDTPGSSDNSLESVDWFDRTIYAFSLSDSVSGGVIPPSTPPVGTPEPASLTLLAVGLAGLGIVMHRRRA